MEPSVAGAPDPVTAHMGASGLDRVGEKLSCRIPMSTGLGKRDIRPCTRRELLLLAPKR